MVRRSDDAKIKKSAKQVLERADALYVSDADERDLLQLIERIRCLVREGAGRAVA
jgi:hypothetical protein